MPRYAPSAVAVALLLAVRPARGVMYPDWQGGTGTCLNSTETSPPYYLWRPENGYLEATLELCCNRYYRGWAYNDCILGGGGNVTGTGKFYPIWQTSSSGDQECAKDCAIEAGGEAACGGLLGPGQASSYDTVTECCAAHFGSLNQDYCVASSMGGTYLGSGQFYLDSSENVCVQDCAEGPGCGGVVTAAWVTLYDSIADCCAITLPSLDPHYCEARSNATKVATDRWFVSQSLCKKDCSGTGPECGTYRWGELYADAEDCCEAKLAHMDVNYCASRSDPGEFGDAAGQPYTGLWAVKYSESMCVQDCDTDGNDACDDIGDSSSVKLYETAAACCADKLGWLDLDGCEALSESGGASGTGGTNRWYADYTSAKRCVIDCPTDQGNAACGGVVSDAGVTKYDTPEDCCAAKFSWYTPEICAEISAGAGTGSTNMWYVDYPNEVCVQDCPEGAAGAAASCAGNPKLPSEPLFDTALACCQEKLGYIDASRCETISANGGASPTVGTDEWYANYQENRCAQDCAVGGGDGCAGILEDLAGVTFYDTAAACCAAKFGWINTDLCAVHSANGGSDGVGTNKFYAHQQDKMCKKDCPTTDGGLCAGPPPDLSEPLYDTIVQCCEQRMVWQTKHICEQTPDSEAGTEDWWINWPLDQCVKNCAEGSGASCGGLAASYDNLYSTSAACCAQPSQAWKPPEDCIYI